jgi:hypothetical protein
MSAPDRRAMVERPGKDLSVRHQCRESSYNETWLVAPCEFDELGAQFVDGFERPHPEQVLLQGSDEALGDAIAPGSRTNDGEASMSRHLISSWKSPDM